MARKSYIGFRNGVRIKNTEVISWTVQEDNGVDVLLSNAIKVNLTGDDAKFFLEEFEPKADFQEETQAASTE